MKPLLSITAPPPKTMAETMTLLQKAAEAHSKDLLIDYERLLTEFQCLWMIVRAKVHLDRLPKGEIRIDTWLRKPSAVASIRDYSIYEGEEEIGYGIYAWTVVHAETRKLVSIKTVPPIVEAPTVAPERTAALKRIPLPEAMEEKGLWIVVPEEIDSNGHVNNVNYVRHGETLCPGALDVEVIFDRECFPGEKITLFQKDGYIRGVKEGGEECFRARFGRNES